MVKVLLPWKMSFYESINGFHPLVASCIDTVPDTVNFIIPDDTVICHETHMDAVAKNLMLASYNIGKNYDNSHLVMEDYLAAFYSTRNLSAQAKIESYSGEVDLVFHHTTPLHITNIPFVLHFESLTTLFWPFIMTGKTHDIEITYQPIYAVIKALLESSMCRGIFTHLKSSHNAFIKVFNSDAISAKSKYIPLGVECPPNLHESVVQKINSVGSRQKFNVLFTNSMNNNSLNFYERGGVEVLRAFEVLLRFYPEATLTVVSHRPKVMGFEKIKFDRLIWIEERIDDDKLYELLMDADVFVLPSAGLHSYSALRAMKLGAVLVCSDAPGYEEYILDGQTGVVIPGRFEQVYQPDPETGWMRDDYSTVYEGNTPIADRLLRALAHLAFNPDERRRIASAAYDHVNRHHAIGPWTQEIAALLNAAVPPGERVAQG